MKNDQSPGSKGYTSEYSLLKNNIRTFITRTLNNSNELLHLTDPNQLGVITCLPRDGEQKQFQNIWRPKTLPNVVYKIALRCIANRIEPFFDKIINKDQTQRKVYRNKYQYENSIFFLNLLMTLLLVLKVHLKTLDPALKSL